MEYIHIKNVEKYHLNYKDRKLSWCKAYFTMINSDPEFEMICEIDKWRFIAFIMLELQLQSPIPLNEGWLARKGFDLKIRPISKTLQMLHTFLDVVTKPLQNRYVEIDIDKERDTVLQKCNTSVTPTDLPLKGSKHRPVLPDDFIKALKENPAYKGIDIDKELAKMDAWLLTHPHRKKTHKFILNWLNRVDIPLEVSQKPKSRTDL